MFLQNPVPFVQRQRLIAVQQPARSSLLVSSIRPPYIALAGILIPEHSQSHHSSCSFPYQVDSPCTERCGRPINHFTLSNTGVCTSYTRDSQPFIHNIFWQFFSTPCRLVLLIPTVVSQVKSFCYYPPVGCIKVRCWTCRPRSRRGEFTGNANTFKSVCNGKISVGIYYGDYQSTTPSFDASC